MDLKEWSSEDVTIKVDYAKCSGHGDCVDVCPSEVYELVNSKAVPLNIIQCVECCACAEACPEEAIDHSACE